MALFDIPDPSDLLKEIYAKIREKRAGASTAPGSNAEVQGWTLRHVVHGLHLHLKYGLLHQMIPTKASGWVLSAWAYLFGLSDGSGGYGRIIARGSTVTDGFTFEADAGPGWVDLNGETFTDTAGQRFQINESYTPSASGTTSALDVIALDTGESTNIEVLQGEEFTWESTPTQMLATITQTVDLDFGADSELDAALRERVAQHMQTPPMGGNWAHWREVAQEASPGNVDAWVYEGLHDSANGYGCTDVACTQRGEVFDGREIEATDAIYDTIDAALEANLPLGGLKNYRLLETNTSSQPFEATITLSPNASESQKCDWDAEDAKFNYAAHSVVNKTVTCSGDVTGHISVGDRVILFHAQAVVTDVGTPGLAADTMFEVESWFTEYDEDTNPYPWTDATTPTAAQHIVSGGGMILNCIGAIRDLYTALGPYRGDNAAPQPGWDDTLRLQSAQAALIGVGDAAGEAVIIDVTIAVPAVDTTVEAGVGLDTYFLGLSDCAIWEVK